jgi:hypothetical protein
MEGITGDDLRAFADANNLGIMNHRNADDWAKMLNRNGGYCPCNKLCPCELCTCKFFEEKKEEQKEEEEKEEEKPELIIENEEIAGAIEALEDAKDLISDIGMDTPHEDAIKKLQEAKKIVVDNSTKHECGQCVTAMQGIGRKLDYLVSECKEDTLSCVMEADATIERIEKMQEIFVGVDQDVAKAQREQNENTENKGETAEKPTSALEGNVEEMEQKKDGQTYHECVRDTMAYGLDDVDGRNLKMCIATKVCAKTKNVPKEVAVKECEENKLRREKGNER